MTTLSQKDAVVKEVKAILGSSFNSASPARDQLSDDQLKTIRANITNGIMNGLIEFKKDTFTEEEVSRYVSGMVSNHLRKAKELNGGETYVPQSTGRGSKDPQIAELSKLLKTYAEGSEQYSQVLSAIESRKAELNAFKVAAAKENKPKKASVPSINMDVLPESLKQLANSLSNN